MQGLLLPAAPALMGLTTSCAGARLAPAYPRSRIELASRALGRLVGYAGTVVKVCSRNGAHGRRCVGGPSDGADLP